MQYQVVCSSGVGSRCELTSGEEPTEQENTLSPETQKRMSGSSDPAPVLRRWVAPLCMGRFSRSRGTSDLGTDRNAPAPTYSQSLQPNVSALLLTISLLLFYYSQWIKKVVSRLCASQILSGHFVSELITGGELQKVH